MTRLFPDYAATPTPTERATARRNNERHQLEMFDTEPEPTPCPVCSSTDHDADACPHGNVTPMFPTRNPSNPAQVRAMFRSLGWPTTGD